MVVSVAAGEVVLSGRLDVTTVHEARRRLHVALDTGSGDLVVDMHGVEMLDATGLGMLVGIHRRAGRSGRRLVLRDLTPQVQRLLRVSRLHRILVVEPAEVPAQRAEASSS